MAKAPGRGAQIELGFPAAGDAVEQEGGAVLGVEGAFDRGPGDGLCRSQLRDSVVAPIRHGQMQTLDSLDFLDHALADQRGERGAVRSGLTQNVRLGNESSGVPGRDTSAPPQRGDDRLLRGSAAQRGRIRIVAEANPALFARLRQAITDAIDRRDGAGLFERGHDGGETAPERRSCRLETRLATLGEQLQEPPLGRRELAEIEARVGQPQIRLRAMRGARREEEGEGVVEAAGALPRQPARGVELVGRNPRRWVDSGE